MIVEYRPAAPIAAHVEKFWYASRETLPHSRERGLPTGRIDIVIPLLQKSVLRYDSIDSVQAQHLHGAVVSGAHDRFIVRGMGGVSSAIGVHFRPGGAAAFFGGALCELRNQTVLLEDLWGLHAHEMRERIQAAPQVLRKFKILEQSLQMQLSSACQMDLMVSCALRALAQDPSAVRISAVQNMASCSPKTFIRRFEAAVGLTPKRFARVLRFNTLLSRVVSDGPRDWAQLALEGGYFDQSHLSNEFKRLSGLSPTAYVPVSACRPTHVAIADQQRNYSG